MGSNKNKKQPTATPVAQPRQGNVSPISPSNPIFQESANDERGRIQNRIVDEQSRYRGQMDPYMNALGEGFGGALERGQQDYGDIMNRYSNMAAGMNPISAERVTYSDPFASYGQFGEMSRTGGYDIPNNDAYQGYKGFADTGGYSAGDIADLRARGVAPIRAAYANAQRDVSRQRSLQGGYSPNATAVLAKMAREQGQAGSDALQNVNAGIIDSRNAGKLSGLQGMAGIDTNRIGNQFKGLAGMSDIEGQRLNAQLQAGTTNAQLGLQAQQYNNQNQMDALHGMSSLYGTTPGMANMFGNQLGNAINNSGQQGSSYISAEDSAQFRPGQYENTKGYINDAATAVNPFLDYLKNRNKGTTGGSSNAYPPWWNDPGVMK
jgi:hypothetical protein